MARTKHLGFRNKLVLNQWLISLFGIDPLREVKDGNRTVRPFHKLADPIRNPRIEGLANDNLHNFYHNLINSELFWNDFHIITREQLLTYEENIVRHTKSINQKRHRAIVWKYYQWLTLLFTELYLDRYFEDRETLLKDLNEFIDKFNRHWSEHEDVPHYKEDDLNKLCLQNATGSGKTLLMHVNLLQYKHYAKLHGKDKDMTRTILLTPNERLSEQHLVGLNDSDIQAELYQQSRTGLFGTAAGLDKVDILEITKLADQDGPTTIATRSLGDQNLLFVDEGHRGMSGKEEGAWFTRRAALCEKGFTFEYSATFEQAVNAAKSATKSSHFEDSYAKSVIFDYSYRWFYEDGFGKDYQILNLPEGFDEAQMSYLTACLLKYYQQLRLYQDKSAEFDPFFIEKPLWVFVGSTVSKAKGSTKDEKAVVTDVAQIIRFISEFLSKADAFTSRISNLITGTGSDTGLIDKDGNDIFRGSFNYLASKMNAGEEPADLYRDISARLFNSPSGGHLVLQRIKGDSGEILLKSGSAEEAFGLINVGDAKGLADHLEEIAKQNSLSLSVKESDFHEAIFNTVKDSSSEINLLIGSKKFVEGWDCWRVSTMGLMHVGKTEGTQIIQLFGRGIRLKGYQWCLRRSGHSFAPSRPTFIEDLETLNVFGIQADFMERFKDFLKDEGLPGNEKRETITLPLNVTYDIGKKLKVIRPKRKAADGKEYDFKKDAAVPSIGDIPQYIKDHPVVVDWYPRIQAIRSRGSSAVASKEEGTIEPKHCSLLNFNDLYFELEYFKREKTWYNINITIDGIRKHLTDTTWYTLFIPTSRMNPDSFDGIRIIQQVTLELLKRYCEHLYNYRKREYIEPRLELRELTKADDNFPQDELYQLIADADDAALIKNIRDIKAEIESGKSDIRKLNTPGNIKFCNWDTHLYKPLFHVRKGSKVTVLPVTLTESEFQFVEDLKSWAESNSNYFVDNQCDLYLLRNMSRGKGIGFFEAGNFHPDFIMWIVGKEYQYVTFIEPHGLIHEGVGSEKIQFYKRIKDIEKRLGDPAVILDSYILSWTKYPHLKWELSQNELEDLHVLFMIDDREKYIGKLIEGILNIEQVNV